jgi:hypothetical protein
MDTGPSSGTEPAGPEAGGYGSDGPAPLGPLIVATFSWA